jgi:AraC-like DNA-binding protein
MARAMLSRYRVLETSDVDEARAEVGDSFCPHGLSLTSKDGRLDVVHHAAPVGAVGLNYLRYGDSVRITPRLFESFYLVQIPLAGTAQVRTGDRMVMSDRHAASLPSPTEPVDMVWSDGCEQLIVYLDRAAVEAYASAGAPGESPSPVVFDPRVDLDAPRMRGWLRLVSLARDELDDDTGLLASGLASSHFEQLLIAGLLAAQPNSSTLSPVPSAAVGSRCTRLALDLIEARPEHPWRVAELAACVGVSSRTLQEAFKRDRGSTPLEELRRVRMAHARDDLLAAGAPLHNVSAIASRWGFFHLGRFAQGYRARYGELPSQTLLR